MPKFRDYFRKMLDEHKEAFDQFAQVHAQYQLDQNTHQEEYNRVGTPIREIIHEWEKKLCGHSEKGEYAKYSVKLAEKFQAEVKAFFPLIDFIGVQVSGPALNLNAPKPVVPEPPAVDPDIAAIDAMDIDDFDLPKLF